MGSANTVHVASGAEPHERGDSSPSGARRRPFLIDLGYAVFAALLAIFAAGWVLRLDRMHLHIPIYPTGDSLFSQLVIKSVITHGWVGHNPDIGAPFGSSMYDFVVNFGDTTELLLIKVMSLFSSDYAALLNGLFVLGFGLCAFAAYGVFRALGFERSVSVAVSVGFATINYHFQRNEGHLFLGTYYAVPAACWLILGSLGHVTLFVRRDGAGGRLTTWATRRTAFSVLAAVFVGISAVYYAIFALVLLGIVVLLLLITQRVRRVAAPIAVMAAIVVSVGVVQLPQVAWHHSHGANAAVGARSPAESELYALKLTNLVMPDPYHRIGFLRTIGAKYYDTTLVSGEKPGTDPALGSVGTIGLLIILIAALRAALGRAPTTPRSRLVRDSGLLATLAFLVGTVGGGGALIAYLLSPQVRGWDRITVFISFFALIGAAAGISWLLGWLRRDTRPAWLRSGRRPQIAGVVLVILIGWFTVWDQTSPALEPDYTATADTWRTMSRFVGQIEQTVPKNSEILQLPYVPFPENPNVFAMGDYEHLRPYLQSTDLRWSYGAIKGRLPEDWGPGLANVPTPDIVRNASAAGFAGIYLDTFGFEDHGVKLIKELTTTLGEQPLRSGDGREAFFDLQPYTAKLAASTSPAELRSDSDELLHPVSTTYTTGFFGPETDGTTNWEWAGPTATLTLGNRATAAREVDLDFSVLTPGKTGSTVTLTLDGKPLKTVTTAAGKPAQVDLETDLAPGDHALGFSTNAPDETSDPRDLHMQIRDLVASPKDEATP